MVRGHMGLKTLWLPRQCSWQEFSTGQFRLRTLGKVHICHYLRTGERGHLPDRRGHDVTLTTAPWICRSSAIGIAVGNNLRLASIDKERWSLGLFPEGGPITFHGEEFVFSYTVQPDDFDSDGVSISQTILDFTIALRTPTSQAQPRLRTTTSQTQSRTLVSQPATHGLAVQAQGGWQTVDRPRGDIPGLGQHLPDRREIDVDITFDHVDMKISPPACGSAKPAREASGEAYYQDGSGGHAAVLLPGAAGRLRLQGLHVGAKTSTGFGAGRIKAAGTEVDALHFFTGVNSSQRVDGRVRVDGMEVLSHPASGDTYRAERPLRSMVFDRRWRWKATSA